MAIVKLQCSSFIWEIQSANLGMSMRNWLFGLQGRILSLDFALRLSRLFGLGEFGLSVYGSCVLPFSEICTKLFAVPLSDPSRNRIRPDTRLKIKERKKSALLSSFVKFCSLTPNIC
jgi:hypothetical protein